MTWNYRIIDFGDHFALHEVYYEKDGKTVKAYTEGAATFGVDEEEGREGVIHSLELALADARRRPVLRKSELPKEK